MNWDAALIAALAMVLQDVAGVVMMQYEANSLTLPPRTKWSDYIFGGWKAWASAILDQAQWTVGITTTTISVKAFGGSNLGQMALVFSLVSLANLIGSRTGQELGIWLLRRRGHSAATVEARILDHEQRLAALERDH